MRPSYINAPRRECIHPNIAQTWSYIDEIVLAMLMLTGLAKKAGRIVREMMKLRHVEIILLRERELEKLRVRRQLQRNRLRLLFL